MGKTKTTKIVLAYNKCTLFIRRLSAAGAYRHDADAGRHLRRPGTQPWLPPLPQERRAGRRAHAPHAGVRRRCGVPALHAAGGRGRGRGAP